jgi:hypothetical protein
MSESVQSGPKYLKAVTKKLFLSEVERFTLGFHTDTQTSTDILTWVEGLLHANQTNLIL